MLGALDIDADMTAALKRGYRDAVAVTDSALAAVGTLTGPSCTHGSPMQVPCGPRLTHCPAWAARPHLRSARKVTPNSLDYICQKMYGPIVKDNVSGLIFCHGLGPAGSHCACRPACGDA